MIPDWAVKLVLLPFAHLVYKVRAVGGERVPRSGPALLVCNHVSFVDAFLVTMACPRVPRFLMYRPYYEVPVVHWLFRAMGVIPVSEKDGPRAIAESFNAARAALDRGEVVCIFAEGEISRHGQLLRFKKGFERVIEGREVPVVPVHLDQVWGSIFSFSEGKVLFKVPRRIPYPVTVSFGTPLPASSDAFAVRQAILELGAADFRFRLERAPSLGRAFAREALGHPWRLAVADSLGMKASYGGLFVKARLAGCFLARQAPEPNVGVLLPPSVAGVIANLGLTMAGKVPINLNYTASPEIIEACRAKAGIGHVVTSRRFLQKLGWTIPGAVYIEDVKPRWLDLLRPIAKPPLDSLATVMFTSGSTGVPKGVMITHANVLSNLLAVAQIYQLGSEDRLMGILPFFHAFGFTASLWMPLLAGMGAVYHYSPLEAKAIGDLVEKFQCTFLMGTPTFLQNFTRRVEPQKFASLRCVVVGAEKLREEVAAAFEAKFGLRPLEGYGCTELSPVASVNIPDVAWPGVKQRGGKPGTVGHPLPGVFMKVVDPETGAALPAGQAGLLLVKGPNVMKGYLGDPALTAESLRDGYYVTGDIASIDLDGFVTITDRLSRFSKIGGEMVPHIRVEERLHETAGLADQTFVVTSVPDPKRGERLVVLHKNYPDVDGLLKRLAQTDLPALWIPAKADFHPVEEFPVLGSGKLDLQKLKGEARRLSAC